MPAAASSYTPGFADAYSAASFGAFEKALGDYLVWNKRGQGPLIEDRGHKIRLALFRAYRDIAPSADRIRAEVALLGYAIRRRLGKSGQPLTVAQEIRARVRSRNWLAASFTVPGWKRLPEGKGQTGRFVARTRAATEIGSVLVRTQEGEESPRVSLLSDLEGALAQSRRRGIVAGVLTDQAADMAVYVARKHREWISRQLAGDYTAVITV